MGRLLAVDAPLHKAVKSTPVDFVEISLYERIETATVDFVEIFLDKTVKPWTVDLIKVALLRSEPNPAETTQSISFPSRN